MHSIDNINFVKILNHWFHTSLKAVPLVNPLKFSIENPHFICVVVGF